MPLVAAFACAHTPQLLIRPPTEDRALVLREVLGLYSNVAIAWVGALVADLVINKPLRHGHHEPGSESGYPAWLRAHGYASERPWTDYVISVGDEMKIE